MTPWKTAFAFALSLPLFAAELGTLQPNLVAHEWGTFTSVAGPNGAPVSWAAYYGPADLPCFVALAGLTKGSITGQVRMETPVLYFYSEGPQTISVNVKFPGGYITEWYPNAFRSSGNAISWDSVKLIPGENPAFPTGKGQSRYYAARNTDATPLESHAQPEKMIFYRGVGSFPIPLEPTLTADGKIEIRNVGKEPIPFVLLFENRGGSIGMRTAMNVAGTSVTLRKRWVIDLPTPGNNIGSARDAVLKALVGFGGLYLKEAQAMLDTWDDSWFEEGMRVIYIMPRPQVDAVLPLDIHPAPSNITRAFVGRIELLSPTVKRTMETAIAAGDIAGLQKFGRFLTPFARQLGISGGVVAQASSDLEARFSSQTCIP